MEIKTIKSCPILGVHIVKATVAEKASGMCDVNETFECMGEDCINYCTITGDGYCNFFQRYTGHEKRGEANESDHL